MDKLKLAIKNKIKEYTESHLNPNNVEAALIYIEFTDSFVKHVENNPINLDPTSKLFLENIRSTIWEYFSIYVC